MKITKIILLLLCVAVCFCSCSKTDDTNVTQTEYDELYNKYTALLDNAEGDAQNLAALQQQYDELLVRYNTLLAESEEDGESLAALQQQYDELYAKYYDKMQMSADTGFDFESIHDFYLKSKQYINMGRGVWLEGKYVKIPISQGNIEGATVTYHGNEIFSNFHHNNLIDTSSNTTSSFEKFSLWVALNDYDITELASDETIYIVGSISNVDFMFSSSGEGYISIALVDCFVSEVE